MRHKNMSGELEMCWASDGAGTRARPKSTVFLLVLDVGALSEDFPNEWSVTVIRAHYCCWFKLKSRVIGK